MKKIQNTKINSKWLKQLISWLDYLRIVSLQKWSVVESPPILYNILMVEGDSDYEITYYITRPMSTIHGIREIISHLDRLYIHRWNIYQPSEKYQPQLTVKIIEIFILNRNQNDQVNNRSICKKTRTKLSHNTYVGAYRWACAFGIIPGAPKSFTVYFECFH